MQCAIIISKRQNEAKRVGQGATAISLGGKTGFTLSFLLGGWRFDWGLLVGGGQHRARHDRESATMQH